MSPRADAQFALKGERNSGGAEYAKEIAEVVLDMTVKRTLRKEELSIPQVLYS